MFKTRGKEKTTKAGRCHGSGEAIYQLTSKKCPRSIGSAETKNYLNKKIKKEGVRSKSSLAEARRHYPKTGETIEYLNSKAKWHEATITGRRYRATRSNADYYNTKIKIGKLLGMHLDKVMWQPKIMESIQEEAERKDLSKEDDVRESEIDTYSQQRNIKYRVHQGNRKRTAKV